MDVGHPDYGTVTFFGPINVYHLWRPAVAPKSSKPYCDLPAGVRLRMSRYATDALDAVRRGL